MAVRSDQQAAIAQTNPALALGTAAISGADRLLRFRGDAVDRPDLLP
jgi:hypothetical protein